MFETNRLYGVLDRSLADQRFVAGDAYTIADMAVYPWILPEQQSQSIDDFPHLRRWKNEIAARPATLRAYTRGSTVNTAPIVTKESARILFRQKARR